MNGFIMLAAMMLTFLDPYTSVYQTDDDQEGKKLASEAGYWPVPNGLKDPLAKKLEARIIHTCFRISDKPINGYDENKESRLFKVNQVGYLPDAPKFAYIGAWLGPKYGAWKPKAPITSWELLDAASGQIVLHKDVPGGLVPRREDGFTKEGTPFTGENTYELDFSEFTKEGEYYLRIPGIGRSQAFRISKWAAEEAFRVHCGGLYQKRCGIAKIEPYTHWTAGKCHANVVRGTFASEEGKLTPKVKWFDIIRCDLEGMENKNYKMLRLEGGWHDAADYDRRPMHLNIVNDLCAVYIMKKENFRDGQLNIPENNNGIADILDEAEWGLRELLAGQQPDGGVGTWIETKSHPVPGNIAAKDTMQYVLAKAT
ncbi:MAG: glycoside hydrolase family 9 protein, partial [Victivallales bacterium]|nr:glycoside hydrolase family 9 protein [Victivallales bacterium]